MWLLIYLEFSIKIQRVSLIHEVTEQFKEIITKIKIWYQHAGDVQPAMMTYQKTSIFAFIVMLIFQCSVGIKVNKFLIEFNEHSECYFTYHLNVAKL